MQIVKDYGTHFLRNDKEIREGAGLTPAEAYSLFRREPYMRVAVFAGDIAWAIAEADSIVSLELDN